jgi:hypothetical protein
MITLVPVFLVALTIKLLFIVTGIWFVVQGFRVHWGWGVANLLIPGAIIPFCIFHPKEAKRPMILAIVCLVVFMILWAYAKYGSHTPPRIEIAPELPASAKNAVLHLELNSFNPATKMGMTESGILSRQDRVIIALPSRGIYNEKRLIAIQADGFLVQFSDRVDGEMRTNVILFPYGQTIETNILGSSIVGKYQ